MSDKIKLGHRPTRAIKFRAWNEAINRMIPWKEMMHSAELMRSVLSYEQWMTNPPKLASVPMQYTGTKDMNGVEIYEDDVLLYGKTNCLVSFNNDNYGGVLGWNLLEIQSNGKICAKEFYYGCSPDDEYCQVIGNVYENPELLESKDE